MSAVLEPHEALRLVPELQAADFRIEAMHGGLTNRVYKLSGDYATYVLRLNAKHTHAFDLDRHNEVAILELVSSVGLAPEVVHADVDKGILLLRYVEGRVWTPTDLTVHENPELLASLLRRVHAVPSTGRTFDAVGIAGRYRARLRFHAEWNDDSTRCMSVIESVDSGGYRYCCCHNDVVAANVIATPDLMLLDWEYACDNEPLFDLASVISYHRLDKTIADTLLGAYTGGAVPELRERLAEQIRVYGALHWLWLACRQALSPSRKQARRLEELRHTIK